MNFVKLRTLEDVEVFVNLENVDELRTAEKGTDLIYAVTGTTTVKETVSEILEKGLLNAGQTTTH